MTGILAAAGPVIPNFGGGGSNSCVRANHPLCWDWVTKNWSGLLEPRLVEHIELTLIAVAVGFAIAFGAALVANRFGWFELPFSLLSGFLYTIPSLALFQVLVGITGLSRNTVLIPLASYTLLILFRNTLIGLRSVPEDVREAARGMGLTRRQTLLRVELPLAVPAILAGLQIATLTVISLATISAYVVDQGLGSPIFEAIQRGPFKTELIAAGGLAILLGFVAYLLIAIFQRLVAPWARFRGA
ncbi:MAG: osmoprotectant transport system permease protein [Thermoleophilaceae bacterium]|nr:osmoprotectant transport system permease protein [Thermoleophilaceae bacterium]